MSPTSDLLYEYDFLNISTFYIELLSVHKQKDEGPIRDAHSVKEIWNNCPYPTILEEDEELMVS